MHKPLWTGANLQNVFHGGDGNDIVKGNECPDILYMSDGDVFSDFNSAEGDKKIGGKMTTTRGMAVILAWMMAFAPWAEALAQASGKAAFSAAAPATPSPAAPPAVPQLKLDTGTALKASIQQLSDWEGEATGLMTKVGPKVVELYAGFLEEVWQGMLPDVNTLLLGMLTKDAGAQPAPQSPATAGAMPSKETPGAPAPGVTGIASAKQPSTKVSSPDLKALGEEVFPQLAALIVHEKKINQRILELYAALSKKTPADAEDADLARFLQINVHASVRRLLANPLQSPFEDVAVGPGCQGGVLGSMALLQALEAAAGDAKWAQADALAVLHQQRGCVGVAQAEALESAFVAALRTEENRLKAFGLAARYPAFAVRNLPILLLLRDGLQWRGATAGYRWLLDHGPLLAARTLPSLFAAEPTTGALHKLQICAAAPAKPDAFKAPYALTPYPDITFPDPDALDEKAVYTPYGVAWSGDSCDPARPFNQVAAYYGGGKPCLDPAVLLHRLVEPVANGLGNCSLYDFVRDGLRCRTHCIGKHLFGAIDLTKAAPTETFTPPSGPQSLFACLVASFPPASDAVVQCAGAMAAQDFAFPASGSCMSGSPTEGDEGDAVPPKKADEEKAEKAKEEKEKEEKEAKDKEDDEEKKEDESAAKSPPKGSGWEMKYNEQTKKYEWTCKGGLCGAGGESPFALTKRVGDAQAGRSGGGAPRSGTGGAPGAGGQPGASNDSASVPDDPDHGDYGHGTPGTSSGRQASATPGGRSTGRASNGPSHGHGRLHYPTNVLYDIDHSAIRIAQQVYPDVPINVLMNKIIEDNFGNYSAFKKKWDDFVALVLNKVFRHEKLAAFLYKHTVSSLKKHWPDKIPLLLGEEIFTQRVKAIVEDPRFNKDVVHLHEPIAFIQSIDDAKAYYSPPGRSLIVEAGSLIIDQGMGTIHFPLQSAVIAMLAGEAKSKDIIATSVGAIVVHEFLHLIFEQLALGEFMKEEKEDIQIYKYQNYVEHEIIDACELEAHTYLIGLFHYGTTWPNWHGWPPQEGAGSQVSTISKTETTVTGSVEVSMKGAASGKTSPPWQPYPNSTPQMCADPWSCGTGCTVGQAQLQVFNACLAKAVGAAVVKTPDKGDPSPQGGGGGEAGIVPPCGDFSFEAPDDTGDCQLKDCPPGEDCCTKGAGGSGAGGSAQSSNLYEGQEGAQTGCWFMTCAPGMDCLCGGAAKTNPLDTGASWNNSGNTNVPGSGPGGAGPGNENGPKPGAPSGKPGL